jgi:chromosome segregation ATPase
MTGFDELLHRMKAAMDAFWGDNPTDVIDANHSHGVLHAVAKELHSIRKHLMTHDEQIAALSAQLQVVQDETALLIAGYTAEKRQITDLNGQLKALSDQLAALLAAGQILDDSGQLATLTAQASGIADSINAVLNPETVPQYRPAAA